MAKYATNANGAIGWPNLIQVTESISGSVVPLAMFLFVSGWSGRLWRERVLKQRHPVAAESVRLLSFLGTLFWSGSIRWQQNRSDLRNFLGHLFWHFLFTLFEAAPSRGSRIGQTFSSQNQTFLSAEYVRYVILVGLWSWVGGTFQIRRKYNKMCLLLQLWRECFTRHLSSGTCTPGWDLHPNYHIWHHLQIVPILINIIINDQRNNASQWEKSWLQWRWLHQPSFAGPCLRNPWRARCCYSRSTICAAGTEKLYQQRQQQQQ